jgi:hypothetical protein
MKFLDKKVVSQDEMQELSKEWYKWNRIHDFDPDGHQFDSYIEHLRNLTLGRANAGNPQPGHKNGGIIKLAKGGKPTLAQMKLELAIRNK